MYPLLQLRLRKGLASRLWEELVLAFVGGSYNLDEILCGIVVSIRGDYDIISLWTDHKVFLNCKPPCSHVSAPLKDTNTGRIETQQLGCATFSSMYFRFRQIPPSNSKGTALSPRWKQGQNTTTQTLFWPSRSITRTRLFTVTLSCFQAMQIRAKLTAY